MNSSSFYLYSPFIEALHIRKHIASSWRGDKRHWDTFVQKITDIFYGACLTLSFLNHWCFFFIYNFLVDFEQFIRFNVFKKKTRRKYNDIFHWFTNFVKRKMFWKRNFHINICYWNSSLLILLNIRNCIHNDFGIQAMDLSLDLDLVCICVNWNIIKEENKIDGVRAHWNVTIGKHTHTYKCSSTKALLLPITKSENWCVDFVYKMSIELFFCVFLL